MASIIRETRITHIPCNIYCSRLPDAALEHQLTNPQTMARASAPARPPHHQLWPARGPVRPAEGKRVARHLRGVPAEVRSLQAPAQLPNAVGAETEGRDQRLAVRVGVGGHARGARCCRAQAGWVLGSLGPK